MTQYLCKIGNVGLVSFDLANGSFYLQDLSKSYDVSKAIRISIDLPEEKAEKGRIYIIFEGRRGLNYCVMPGELSDILFKYPQKVILEGNIKPNIQLLSQTWATDEPSFATGLTAFLSFFADGTILNYVGEYGTELVCFLPFVRYLFETGNLKSRKICSYEGMKPYYYFLPDSGFAEITQNRKFAPEKLRFPTANLHEYTARKSCHETYFDYRSQFSGNKLLLNIMNSYKMSDRPIIYLQNKFTVEWGEGPINYFPLLFLETVFENLGRDFNFIYSRPGIRPADGFSVDHNDFCNYPDYSLIKSFGVPIVEEVETEVGYNYKKLAIMANVNNFISVQGGGSYTMPLFFDSTLLILHKRGGELDSETYSQEGFYSYLNGNTNKTYVSTSMDDLWIKANTIFS